MGGKKDGLFKFRKQEKSSEHKFNKRTHLFLHIKNVTKVGKRNKKTIRKKLREIIEQNKQNKTI